MEQYDSTRVRVFNRELERLERDRRREEAKKQKEMEARRHYDEHVAQAKSKHFQECVRTMLAKYGKVVDGQMRRLYDFTVTLAYEKDDKAVVQLRTGSSITFATLDTLAEIFATKEIDIQAEATEGSGGCESCDYGAGPESYHIISISGATVDLNAVERPQFGPFKPGWFLVVAPDRPTFNAWVSHHVIEPGHAVIMDHVGMATCTFWDKELWKVVVTGDRTQLAQDLVDHLVSLGFKELEEA